MAIEVNTGDKSQFYKSSTTINRISETQKNSCFEDYNNAVIDSCDEQIAKNKETIKEKKNLWNWAKNAIKNARNAMHSILSKFGVNSYKKINDSAKQKEYLSYMNDKSSYRRMQIGASSAILRASIDTSSACSTKLNAINSQAIGELLAG